MVNILGVHFKEIDFGTAVKTIEGYIQEGHPRQIVTANADFVIKAQKDPEFKSIINSSDLVLADGMSVIMASKFLGTPLPERIAGIDLAFKLCERAETKGYRIYFLGAEKKALEKATEFLKKKYPGLYIAGQYSPSFGKISEEEEMCIKERIKSSSADILFVCLGSGKQEKWIRKHMDELGIAVCIGLGSFLDIMAGKVKRAPRWAQRAGLEWIFRFAQDPVRLFKRYMIDTVKFLFLLLHEKVRKR